MAHGPGQANEPSSVVDDKGDVTSHANALEQVAQVAHSPIERVGIPGVVRLLGEAAPIWSGAMTRYAPRRSAMRARCMNDQVGFP